MDLKFEHASQRSDGLILDVLPRGSMDWNLGRASQRFDGFESWTCFPEVQWIEVLDVLPRGPMV